MGVVQALRKLPLFCLFATYALAAPALRLTETTIGPVSIGQGQTARDQEIEAYNAGDSQLSLTFTSDVNWVSASANAPRNCTRREGLCIPVRIAFLTTNLAPGVHAGRITVRDPNAVDAPQDILVTVQINGGIPNQINFFVAPNGPADEFTFQTNSQIASSIATQSGGDWLSLALDGFGSFRFVLPYRVTGRHVPGLAEGTYNGTLTVRNSTAAFENKTVQVSLRVAAQPIAKASVQDLFYRVAQNPQPVTQFVAMNNRGVGTLAINNVTVSTASGGEWLKAERIAGSNLVSVQASAANVAPGAYTGTVTITTNAVNGTATIPVSLQVVAAGPPVIGYQRVVNNASFGSGEDLAPGGIVAIFGEQLSFQPAASASSLPLPTELGGARVFVNDRPAPVFFSSYGQINFQIPFDTNNGFAAVRVDREGQRGNTVSIRLVSSEPRMLRYGGNYAIAVNPDGTLVGPTRLGIPNVRPARRGEAIVIYSLGLGRTEGNPVSGAASPGDPLPRVPGGGRILFDVGALGGGIGVDTLYTGLTPGFVGLYQSNVVVPANVSSGDVRIQLLTDTGSSDIILTAVE